METAIQVTQLLTNIVVILLFAGILFVLINLIKQVRSLSKKVSSFSNDFSEIKPKVVESLDKINFLADSLTTVTKSVNENIEVLGTVVEKVKDTADSVIEFEQKIQKTIEPPIMDTVNTISAVSIGIKTFFDTMKSSKSKISEESGNAQFDESQDTEDIYDDPDYDSDVDSDFDNIEEDSDNNSDYDSDKEKIEEDTEKY